jgi:hypothetical protein
MASGAISVGTATMYRRKRPMSGVKAKEASSRLPSSPTARPNSTTVRWDLESRIRAMLTCWSSWIGVVSNHRMLRATGQAAREEAGSAARLMPAAIRGQVTMVSTEVAARGE